MMLARITPQPVDTPTVEWAGLFPLMILGGGALAIVMVRSVVRRFRGDVESVAVTCMGPLTVVAMYLAGGAAGTDLPLTAVRAELGEPLFLAGFGSVMVLAAAAVHTMRMGLDAAVTAGLGLAALSSTWALWDDRLRITGPFDAIGDQFGIDGFMLVFTGVMVSGVILVALLLDDYLRREGLDGPEMYVLMLISAAGGVVMAGAGDLIVLFLGLETLSIAAYVMAAMHLRRSESSEAGMKYFVLGAVASAFLLYGIAMVYGATGSTNLTAVHTFLHRTPLIDEGLLAAGLALLLVGFGFKVAAAPFHTWTPDVYQGSPTPVVAFMASVVKAAGFAAFVRVFVVAFADYADDWRPVVAVLAALTLVVGSVSAVVQSDVKRMLAYSSIGHTGFILTGVAAGADGIPAVVFYVVTYAFVVIGSFGVLAVVSGRGDRGTSLDDLDGLGARNPVLAAAFTVLLLAQAGVPFTTGFVAKFEVIGAAVEARWYWLAILAMATAVVSTFAYLRIVLSMYLGAPAVGERLLVPRTAKLAIVVAVVVTVGFGILPAPIDDLSRDAVLMGAR